VGPQPHALAREEARGLRERLEVLEAQAPDAGHQPAGGAAHAEPGVPAGETAGQPAQPGGGEQVEHPFARMMEAMRPMVESQVTQMAKGRATGISAAMKLDSEEAKKLADALGAEAARQMDLAWDMLFGDAEIDPDMLGIFQGMMTAEISEELENELTAFMSDDEIHAFRAEYKTQHEKQREQMVDMSITMMAIPDLTDDQRGRLREALTGSDPMREWNLSFARLMREPEKAGELISDPKKFAAEMKKGHAAQREQMRSILTDTQLEAATKSYDGMIEMMRRQIELFAPQPQTKKSGSEK
jgi:hypothetical protein